MTENEINKTVTALAKSLQERDYDTFVSFFTADAVFEIPFTVNGGTLLKGLTAIKEHFENVRQNPLTKLIRIDEVSTLVYHSTSGNTVTVEYFIKGTSVNTGEAFEIQSSIAVIQFNEQGIQHYKDFPNTLGIAKKAGVLPQLAAAWMK
jgi:ketosteroid isomerase-like protein